MDFLFDDVFVVREIDPEGKKFDRVSRIRCESENYGMDLLLDVATEIYTLKPSDRFHCVLSSSLMSSPVSGQKGAMGMQTGGADKGFYDPELSLPPASRTRLGSNLADKFEYVMYGKLFKVEEAGTNKASVFISYGGLLMRLQGDPRHWRNLTVGCNVFLLIRRM